MKALDQIREVISQREDNYDEPEYMFGAIAELWSTYLFGPRGHQITASDAAAMMTLFKIARSVSGANESTADDLLDAVGYSAFAADLRTLEARAAELREAGL